MIPFVLAAIGGYLIYDSTKKQRSPLDNPYNILADGGEMEKGGKLPNINDVREDGELIDSQMIDEGYVSNAGEQEFYKYKDKTYVITTWNERAEEHKEGEEEISIWDTDDDEYKKGGEVGRFKILKDETGYVEQGFYGVFDTQNNELLDIFEFRKEAEGFAKELNEKGISKAEASKYNGRINDYVLAKGGKIKSKKWIQDALSGGKNKGALRKTAKRKGLLRGDENLSATDLKKLQKMGGTTAKRAHMAETLRKLK